MKKYFLLLLLTAGCSTMEDRLPIKPEVKTEDSAAPIVEDTGPKPKYAIGDCLMIVDLPSGETDSPYRVKVEKIQSGAYWYRWWLGAKLGWAIDLDSVGKFDKLEKISKKVKDCPPS